MRCLNEKVGTSSTSCEFAIDIHEVGEFFGFFILGGIGSLFGRVQHISFNILIIKIIVLSST